MKAIKRLYHEIENDLGPNGIATSVALISPGTYRLRGDDFEFLPVAEQLQQALFPDAAFHQTFNLQRRIVRALYEINKSTKK